MTLQKLLDEIKKLKSMLKMDDSYLAMKLVGIKETVEAVDIAFNLKNRTMTTDKILLWQQIKEELK